MLKRTTCSRCRARLDLSGGREFYAGTSLIHERRTCGPIRVPRPDPGELR